MIKLSDMLAILFIFTLLSGGIYIVLINIGISNPNLNNDSKKDLVNLGIYNNETSNPFTNKSLNYSLTVYSNTNDFTQSNIETKGAYESILDILGNNKLTALTVPFYFLNIISPIPSLAYNWALNSVLGYIGILVFLGFLGAWKAGLI